MSQRRGPTPMIVREFVAPLDPPTLDLRRIRQAFGALMDEAAREVQGLGYEQDDSIIERLLDLRYVGELQQITVPADFLTDSEHLVACFHREHHRRFGRSYPHRQVEAKAARAKCLIFGGPA